MIYITVFFLLIAYLSAMISRIVYTAENWDAFNGLLEENSLVALLKGSMVFDTSAIMYTNAIIVLLLILLPRKRYGVVCWLFTIINATAVILNLGDAVYFKYTGHRTTVSVFSEFSNEGNIWKIIAAETAGHWYLFVIGIVMIFAVFLSARKTVRVFCGGKKTLRREITERVVLLILFLPLCIFGIRGGIGRAVRPITLSNANQYVSRPSEAAIVLNTPFSLLRSVGKSVFNDPKYFTAEEMEGFFSPVHHIVSDTVRKKNVVILIMESFGKEYIGAFNKDLDNGTYEGYTPFTDSLVNESMTFTMSFANGRKSIDAMPSILSGIPHFVEPFFLTPAAMNDVSGIAGQLSKHAGYYSAFFHGAENGSMGFEAFAKASGYKDYYGRREYDNDRRFGGDNDFDGTWAIWDEPFLQFFALKMTEFREPFVTTVFTASNHHPYGIPIKYKDVYKDVTLPKIKGVVRTENPIHKCVSYSDYSLKRFFQTAQRQRWYKNTIFVITADHTNLFDHEIYSTDLGLFSVPIIFFDPSGEMPKGISGIIAQHTDIMPTILSWLGVSANYIAWGKNLLATSAEEAWAVNYNGGIYQYVKGDYVVHFDGKDIRAVYNFRKDPMMKRNILSAVKNDRTVRRMTDELKAVIQSYMQRMTTNGLVVRE